MALHVVSYSPAWLLKVKAFTRVKKKRVGETGRGREEEGERNRTAPVKAGELSLSVLLNFVLRLCNTTAVNPLPDRSWLCKQWSCAWVTFLLKQ